MGRGQNEPGRQPRVYTDQLTYFLLAYETRSYAAAARRAFLTPQGLAKAIHTFERELGCELFVESDDGLIPTSYAEEVRRFAVGFSGEYARLRDTILRMQEKRRQVVRVGVSLGVMGILGLDFFARFEDAHPGTSVRYEEVPDIPCDDGLLENRYELALTIFPYNEAFETVDLGSMALSMWVNVDDPLSRKERVGIEDLEGRVIAMPGTGFKNFVRLQSLCQQRGVTPRRILQSHQMHWVFDFVKEGKGIGTNVDVLLSTPGFQSDKVVSLPFEDFTYRYGISWMKERTLNEAERELVDYTLGRRESM